MDFTLWPACVRAHPFEDQLEAAASAGFDRLCIGPITYQDLIAGGNSPAAIVRMARKHGVALGHYDGFSDWAPIRFGPDLPDAARDIFDVSTDDCLRICNELGLNAICAVGAFQRGQVAMSALIEGFADFCSRAATAGLRVDLEFVPMWGVATLEDAWTIVRESGAENAGILLDMWHFFRGDPDMELLRSLPEGSISAVQLTDAAASLEGNDLFDDCLHYRRLPDQGELPVREVMEILRDKGGVRSVGPEVFSDELDRLDPREAALRTAASSQRVMARAGWKWATPSGGGNNTAIQQPTLSKRTTL